MTLPAAAVPPSAPADTSPGTRLYGRRAECRALDRLVADVRAGQGQVLILRGEAGAGKSVLLDYLAEQASGSGCRVARVVGVESEMELAFAGLHQLCVPMLSRAERLPVPHRDALRIAFGLAAGSPPDRFFVGLAVLSLLAGVARNQPLICLVDDEHWLDRASAQALGFAARRLAADPIGLVLVVRNPSPELAELPELHVGGLRDHEARELLASVLAAPLDEQVADRIVAETCGNPLALLEVPRGLSAAELAGFGTTAVSAVPGRVEDTFRQRIAALPEPARHLLLLLAAADPLGEPALVWRAAERQGISAQAAAPAAEAGLCKFGTRVRFRHPLARAAAYGTGSPDQRRAAHAAIAEVTDAESHPDRRAWHRAHACAGPDEAVAAELERSAVRARARGGQAAAAAFLERSAELTLDPARRAGRALAAAEASYLAGSGEDALRLAGTAERGPIGEFDRVRVDVLRGRVATIQRRVSDAAPLLHAARRLERFDRRAARDTYRDAFIAATYAGRSARGVGLPEVAAAIRSAAPSADPPSVTDDLLDAAAELVDVGYAAGAPAVQRALAAFRAMPATPEFDLHWVFLAGRVSTWVWDQESWDVLSGRMLQLVRNAGVLALLPFADAARVGWELFAGDLAAVSAHVEEQDRIHEAIGSDSSPGSRVILAAYRGHQAEVAELDETTTRDADARGDGTWPAMLNWSKAVLGNGLSRYDEALKAAQLGALYPPDMHISSWALSELVEAAARCGRPEAAADAIRRLAEMARACGTEWVLGVEARARALVAGPADADDLYRQAIDRLGRTRFRTELARAHLLYGEWLRRQGRRVDARQQLRTAHEMLAAIGMTAFADRARYELIATGETMRKRRVETVTMLTAQEALIARLARDGRTNPEIGAQLFLSGRTVEWHLRKVFTKLGISSRRELHTALTQSRKEDQPA